MAESLTFRIGENKRISHIITAESTFTASSVAIDIYNSAGTATVSNGSGSVDNSDPALEHEIYYRWNTAAVSAGDYIYLMKYVVGAETLAIRGEVTVFPVTSKYDKWIQTMGGYIQETDAGEVQQLLSYRDYMNAANTAVKYYDRFHPRPIIETETLSAGDFEYDIFASWINNFSQVQLFEYPVSDSSQDKDYLCSDEFEIDELRNKWRFTYTTPSAGETARVTYTTSHTLNHTTDTIPDNHFEWVSMYAAGKALLMLANKAAQVSSAGMGADVVNYRTKQQEYLQQAKEMMQRAERGWGTSVSTGGFVTWNYLADHGRIYY